MPANLRVLVCLAAIVLLIPRPSAAADRAPPTPLAAAHAHNDYLHERPLLDALDHGFASVEADVFLIDGKLLVAHTILDLKPERTLEKLYLDPLRERAKTHGGKIYPQSAPFTLLIDIKTDAEPTYAALAKVLADYADIFSVVRDGQPEAKAVTAIISGERPWDTLKRERIRYAGIDGRLSDLDLDLPAHLLPWISDNWTKHFQWQGDGEMPAAEREKLRSIVERAHARSRSVRFWATPDNPRVWRELRAAGVDLINTDDLAGLEMFLRNENEQPRTAQSTVYPAADWEARKPDEVGLSTDKLVALSKLVGGRGCVVRHGYLAYTWGDAAKSGDVASAVKPLISTLLLIAVEEKRLASVDAPVADVEPRLKSLNGGKDAHITWRHLASQTSGYGLTESPGAAYSYNDFALALYYDTLTQKVFQENGTATLKARLADVLQFQDACSFEAFGPDDRPGRLAISPRDFARFGLLVLRHGKWRDRQVVPAESLKMALTSPLPADTPLTAGKDADMLPHQRSLGGGKNITRVGPGYYSFNWWLNTTDREGRRLFVDAPSDAFVATGHGGERMLWIIPSLDLVVSWNDAQVDDHDASPGNAQSKCNQAARLIVEACEDRQAAVQPNTARPTRKKGVTIHGSDFHIDGRPTYAGRTWNGKRIEGLLFNARLVQAAFDDLNPDTRGMWAYPDTGKWDPDRNTRELLDALPSMRDHGLLGFTVNLQGGNPRTGAANQPWHNSAITPEGTLRPDYMARLEKILDRADELRMVAIVGVFYFGQDQRLQDEAAVVRALDAAVDWLAERGYTNVLLEVNNECNVDYDHAILRPERVHELIARAQQRSREAVATGGHPLLVSTSYGGSGIPGENVVRTADFLLLHGNGVEDSDKIAQMVRQCRQMPGYRPMPILFNEDDHYDFDRPKNHLVSAIGEYCGWGYFDGGQGNYIDGHQSPPVNWGINTPRKRAFFDLLKQITGE